MLYPEIYFLWNKFSGYFVSNSMIGILSFVASLLFVKTRKEDA